MIRKSIYLGLLIIFLAACSRTTDSEAEAFLAAAREVEAAAVLSGDIAVSLEFSGKAEAELVADLAPALSGTVKELHVREGSYVSKDQLLITLDQANLEQAGIQYRNLEKNYRRMTELLASGAVEQAAYDEIEAAYLAARSGYEYLKENTEIRAPFNGLIAQLRVLENEKYDAMMDPFLIRLLALDRMKVRFQVADADINQLKVGQLAVVTSGDGRQTWTGKVSFLSPEADPLSGTFRAELVVENSGHELKHNQFVRISVYLEQAAGTLIIPVKALIEDSYVFVIENDKVARRAVVTGLESEYQIEVKSGLRVGELVVVTGNVGMQDGDKVRILN